MPHQGMHRARTFVAVIAGGLMACHFVPSRAAPRPPAAAAAGSQTQTAPRHSSSPYSGPAVSIDKHPDTGRLLVSITFSTGGWELRTDRADVIHGLGLAHLTFIGPGTDELVTQALVEKQWEWPSKEPIARAEVWVNVVRRRQAPAEAEYRLAARFPADASTGPTPEAAMYRCGNEQFGVAFAESRATVTLKDGSVVSLDRLKSSAEPEHRRTFTNGRLTFVQESSETPRVMFARGRMVPVPCDAVE